MTGAKYLTIEELVPKSFLERPSVIIAEYGNGFGKTYAACSYAVQLQNVGVMDRIYILEPSQDSCENAVSKIEGMKGKVVWHIGLEKFCPLYDRISVLIRMGIPAAYYCLLCRYFKGKSKLAFRVMEELLQDPNVTVVAPKVYRLGLERGNEVCLHPLIRAFVLDPTFEIERKLRLPYTPIFVAPSQIFLSHQCILKWNEFKRRQKKSRRILLIIDEADTIFFSSLKVEIPYLEFTEEDRLLLRQFSPKTKDLTKILAIYEAVYGYLYKLSKDTSISRLKHVAREIRSAIRRAEPLIRSFDRRKKQIIGYIMSNRIFTRVFLAVNVLKELLGIENLEYTLRTAELSDDGSVVLYDYDHGIRVLFDTTFPYRNFWKICLSATFPSRKLASSSFLSPEASRLLFYVQKRSRGYENVYVTFIEVFDSVGGMVNRNEQLRTSWPKILSEIRRLYDGYSQKFGVEPRGIAVWFGNKKQLKTFIDCTKRLGINFVSKGGYYVSRYRRAKLLFCYCGSSISRGIDLNSYDISIIVAPLLRPPRRWGFLDVVDFARGVAELIQAAMRIVRSPRPDRPKLVVIERTLTGPFYASLYPDWFRELAMKNYLDL